MKTHTWHIVILTLGLLVGIGPVFGLNEPSHRLVNIAASNTPELDLFLQQVLGLPGGLREPLQDTQVIDWIGLGGDREDEGLRILNHFHDPLRSWDSAGLFGNSSSIRWMQQTNQGWSWQNARGHYWTALTATTQAARDKAFADTFRALGQVMHLVVDASVPEHVRNDIHPFEFLCRTVGIRCFGNYEYWVTDNHGRTGSPEEGNFISTYLSTPVGFDSNILQQPTNDSAAPVTVARLIDTDTYTGTGSGPNVTLNPAIGIGEFANANFFSEDTISGAYPFPNVSALVPSQVSPPGTGKVFRYYAKGAGDGIANDVAAAECILDQAARDQGIFSGPTYFCVDETVWSRTAQVMLPRAVGYARGVLDYFFRGRIDAITIDMGCYWPQVPPLFPTAEINIFNLGPDGEETGAGQIDIIVNYEAGGVKHSIPWVSSQSIILGRQGDETRTNITVSTAPLNAVPTNAVNVFMIVTYRGPLGQETNAVIGAKGSFIGIC